MFDTVRLSRRLSIAFSDMCPFSRLSSLFCSSFYSSLSLSCFLYSCVPLLVSLSFILFSIFVLPKLISLYLSFLLYISSFFAICRLSQFAPATANMHPPPFSFTQMLRISRAPEVLEFWLERNYLERRHCSALHSLFRLIELRGRENPKLCLQLSESDDGFVSSRPESLM